MRNPDPESIAKSVAAAIADRLTHRDRIADEIAVAISDAYARGYSDALTVLNTQRLTDPVSIAAESGSVISVTSAPAPIVLPVAPANIWTVSSTKCVLSADDSTAIAAQLTPSDTSTSACSGVCVASLTSSEDVDAPTAGIVNEFVIVIATSYRRTTALAFAVF
jgi:hypothetical protein